MSGREAKGVAGYRVVGSGAADTRRGGAETDLGSTAGIAEGAIPPGIQYVKIAAIYARVSTERQEKEQTIDSQLDALHRAAREGGYEVWPGHVFTDERCSGARLDRPGLDRLRDLASEGRFEAVLVYSPDRLARRYAYQVLVMEELQRSGCEVVFLNQDLGESPEERMLLQIQGVFAEYERALIQERARQGRVNWSHAPYDYRIQLKTESAPQ